MTHASIPVAGAFRLTSTQRGMLAESLLHPGVYLEQVVAEFAEPLDVGHLRGAWQHALSAFDALRLHLDWSPGADAKQRIETSTELPFRVVDLSDRSGSDRARLDDFLRRDRREGLNLQTVPLMRITVLIFDEKHWAFVWTIHHTIIDGASYVVVLKHVFDTYDRLLAGQQPVRPISRSFETFLAWLEQQDFTLGHRHIDRLLEGFSSATPLPLCYGQNGVYSGRSQEVHARLTVDESRAVTAAARATATSVNALVQFAWALLLSRYGDSDDVVFGATWSGRINTLEGAELVVGPCLNTLPVRVNVTESSTVRDALRRLREQHLAMRPFQQTPLAAVGPDVARNLFQTIVVFEFERFGASIRRLDGRWDSRSLWSCSQSNYPLSLSVYFEDEALTFHLEYSADLYTAETAARVMGDYSRLVRAVSEQLDTRPIDLPMLSPELFEALTTGAAGREEVPPEPRPIDRILRHAVTAPTSVAIRQVDGPTLTYAELNGRIWSLAQRLRARGVGEGALVGILMPRSIDRVISMLATHAVGGAFLPLDPADPSPRLAWVVGDAKVSCLMVAAETAGTIPNTAGLELLVDHTAEATPTVRELPVPAPSDSAYVVYTSGSTGQPKGVCIPHSALANHVASIIAAFDLGASDRVLQFASLGFDVSLEEILPTLSVGATVVLRNEEMSSSARRFFELVATCGVTVLNLPTAFWHSLTRMQQGRPWPHEVRLLIVGGERVSSADLVIFRQSGTSHIRFLNGYGPTEATITSTLYDDAEGDHAGDSVPIGRPLHGHSHFVLDRHLRPMPPGAVGQLYIGGAGLATGYLNNPVLTSERFPSHPFRSHARLYATGDRVWQTERGNYTFVDRIDDQVKLRGFRIELGEIETYLKNHPGVTDAAVVLCHLPGDEPALHGFVTLRDPAVSVETLRAHAAGFLPRHMVPRLLLVDALPLTPSGKIDRRELSTRHIPPNHEVVDAPPPANSLEHGLLKLWSGLLGTPVTAPSTTFFEAGGHSLLVLQMLAEVERRFNRSCDARLFLANPTVGSLAALLLSDGRGVEPVVSVVRLSRGNNEARPLFLAPGLFGLSSEYSNLANALHPDIPVYAIQHGPTSVDDAVHRTLTIAARRYADAIRTVQPIGPYAIAGYSAGGIVAVAIAQAMHKAGDATDFVGVIDSTPPALVPVPPPFTSFRRTWRMCRTIGDRFGEFLDGPRALSTLWLRVKSASIRSLTRWFPMAAWRTPSVDDVIQGTSERHNAAEVDLMQRRLDAILTFEPDTDPVDIVLLRTRFDPFEGPHEADLAWSRAITGRVDIEQLPGAHEALLTRDGATGLARVLDKHLLIRKVASHGGDRPRGDRGAAPASTRR